MTSAPLRDRLSWLVPALLLILITAFAQGALAGDEDPKDGKEGEEHKETDSDGDGLPDEMENKTTGTDWTDFDTDDDGIGDGDDEDPLDPNVPNKQTDDDPDDTILGTSPMVVTVASSVSAATLLVLLAVVGRERLRWTLPLMLAPLYSKLSRHKVMENTKRSQIYEAIMERPGIRLHELRDRFGKSSLEHNLTILRQLEFITFRKYRNYLEFHPRGHAIPPPRLTEIQEKILHYIRDQRVEGRNWVPTSELRELIGARKNNAVLYHLHGGKEGRDNLTDRGMIIKKKVGRGYEWSLAK